MMMRVTVGDLKRWGMLVKSWSTGRNYFNPATPPPPIPRTLQELQDTCRQAGIPINIPATVTKLSIVQYAPDTLTVRLPPKEFVEASENSFVEGTADYIIPEFYKTFIEDPPTTKQGKLDFHAQRLGEYTVNSCM
jgi:hypothetical protein